MPPSWRLGAGLRPLAAAPRERRRDGLRASRRGRRRSRHTSDQCDFARLYRATARAHHTRGRRRLCPPALLLASTAPPGDCRAARSRV